MTNLTREQAFSGVTHRTLLKVWVGADDFGRSQGVALINAGSSAETWRLVEALDGCVLNGRSLKAEEAQPQPTAGLSQLPLFKPAWLSRARLTMRRSLRRPPDEARGRQQDDPGRAW